jgi:hypothetical protein
VFQIRISFHLQPLFFPECNNYNSNNERYHKRNIKMKEGRKVGSIRKIGQEQNRGENRGKGGI